MRLCANPQAFFEILKVNLQRERLLECPEFPFQEQRLLESLQLHAAADGFLKAPNLDLDHQTF